MIMMTMTNFVVDVAVKDVVHQQSVAADATIVKAILMMQQLNAKIFLPKLKKVFGQLTLYIP